MRVAMTIFVAGAAWVSASSAQTPPVTLPTELAAAGVNGSITHVCTDREDLSLTASNTRVALTGTCHSLLIRGSGNTVNAEAPLDVDVTGNNNSVTWPKTPAEPHLNFDGTGNTAGSQKS